MKRSESNLSFDIRIAKNKLQHHEILCLKFFFWYKNRKIQAATSRDIMLKVFLLA